jgi:hypothetical protein
MKNNDTDANTKFETLCKLRQKIFFVKRLLPKNLFKHRVCALLHQNLADLLKRRFIQVSQDKVLIFLYSLGLHLVQQNVL